MADVVLVVMLFEASFGSVEIVIKITSYKA